MVVKDILYKKLKWFKNIKNIFKPKKEDSNKIKLDIMGISYNKKENENLYVVVLGEENGNRKIPVIINYLEAQSIAIEVEKISPIVPLIYDSVKTILMNHKIKYDEILITDFKNDILYTYLMNKKEKIEIRTADALSMSVRMGYPIYIYDDILTKLSGLVQKFYDIKDGRNNQAIDTNKLEDYKLNNYNIDELEDLLNAAIEEEEYEKASEIRDEIINKKINNN